MIYVRSSERRQPLMVGLVTCSGLSKQVWMPALDCCNVLRLVELCLCRVKYAVTLPSTRQNYWTLASMTYQHKQIPALSLGVPSYSNRVWQTPALLRQKSKKSMVTI